MKKTALLSAVLLVSACSSGGDEIVFDTVLGPVTEAQLETLPNTLEGDRANANHMTVEKTGTQMTSSDGSEQ